MSRSEDFDSEFWSDPDVAELSRDARYLYIWTWTNPRCNMSGAYRITRALIEAETGLNSDQLRDAFAELEEHRFAYYDGRVVWVRARVKRLRQKTPNIAKSIGTHLRKLPEGHPYIGMFLAEYDGAGWLADHISGLSTEGPETVDDTYRFSDEASESSTLSGLSPDSPRDGLGERKEGGVGETTLAPSRPKPLKFKGRVVPQPQQLVAYGLLREFNRQAGTNYKPHDAKAQPSESLKRILGALVAHPTISAELGARMIAAAFRDPFWKDTTPHPGVVFGPGVVERNLEAAAAAGRSNNESLAALAERMNERATA